MTPAGKFAAGTEVPVERSRAEIEGILARYGADQFMYGWDQRGAVVAFRATGRHVRFVLPLPDRQAEEFRYTTRRVNQHSTPRRVPLSADAQDKAYEQATRQRWRALALVVKAKLEAIEVGISTFDQEFLAQLVLPNGSTVGETLAPQLDEAYTTGIMPAGLLGLPAGPS